MPYTSEQCKLFAAMVAAGKGDKVPKDWKQHCTKTEQKKAEQAKNKKHKQ